MVNIIRSTLALIILSITFVMGCCKFVEYMAYNSSYYNESHMYGSRSYYDEEDYYGKSSDYSDSEFNDENNDYYEMTLISRK